MIHERLAVSVLLLLLAVGTLAGVQGSDHVHIRIHAVDTRTKSKAAQPSAPSSEEPPTLSWFPLDPSQFQIASCAPQTWEMTRKEAALSLSLYFKALHMPGDQVIISTLNGSFSQVLGGSAYPNGVTTDPVPGRGVRIEFRPSKHSPAGCKATGNAPTMQLEAVGVQWMKSQVSKESSCSDTQVMTNAVCSKGTTAQDQMYRHARPVLRLSLSGSTCTGWLWGNQGHIVTNHHCIYNQGMVDGAQFQFGYQTKGCTDDASKCDLIKCREDEGVVLDGKNGSVRFITSDPVRDFAIVQIMDNPAWYVKAFGYLQIRNGQAKAGETVYVPQHPHGQPKMIAMMSDRDPKSPATITKVDVKIATGDQIVRTNMIAFSADAKRGSSGSPVIATKDNLVVGLLLSGDCDNTSATPCQTLASRFSQIVENNDGIAFSP